MSRTTLPVQTKKISKRLAQCSAAVALAVLSMSASADFIALGHPNNDSSAKGYLFVFGADGTTGTVKSKNGVFDQTFAIDATGLATIEVPSTQFLNAGNTVSGKALLVQSANPISGYFLNRLTATTDMSYLLDMAALGTNYSVLGWESGGLQMSVTAVKDGTTVTVTPAAALLSGQPAGAPFDVSLSAGESVIYFASKDLSGSQIVANQPVAVFSGSTCANVPTASSACDHLFTQLPAVEHFATEFVVPETAKTGKAGNLVRILAAEDDTEVTVNGTLVATLAAGKFHQIDTAHDLHITTSKPVMVGQFLKGMSQTGYGDPAFSFVPGIDQLLDDYVFTTPTGSARYVEDYLNLAVPSSAVGSVVLNGVPVDASEFTPVGTSGFSSARLAVTEGAGHIKASVPFVATLSGFSAYDSYHTIIGTTYSSGASPQPSKAGLSQTTLITTGASLENGDVYVWGFRGSAQQGNGKMVVASNEAPAKVDTLSNVKTLTGGAYHLIALDGNGDIYGWGQSGYGETGCAPTKSIYVETPCKVLENGVQVAAGEYFSIALDKDGQVWTWGHNLYGQLGTGVKGTKYNTRTPQAVNLQGETARLIGAAYEGAFAVTEEGHVWAWGDNEASGLGIKGSNYGVQQIIPTPTHIANLDAYAKDITYIAGGNGWGEALLKDGTVIGWGLHAALGQNTTKTHNSSPEPIQIMTDVKQLFARYVGSFALDTSGKLYTWGQTGGSAFKMIYGETPTLRTPTGTVTAIGGGKEHLLYKNDEGKVFGIGYNDLHKLDQSKCCAPTINWPGKEITIQ